MISIPLIFSCIFGTSFNLFQENTNEKNEIDFKKKKLFFVKFLDKLKLVLKIPREKFVKYLKFGFFHRKSCIRQNSHSFRYSQSLLFRIWIYNSFEKQFSINTGHRVQHLKTYNLDDNDLFLSTKNVFFF